MLHALRAWGDKCAVDTPPLRVEHHGHPVRTRVICATCGERVRGDDLDYISTVPDWDIPGLKRGAEQAARPADQSPVIQAGVRALVVLVAFFRRLRHR